MPPWGPTKRRVLVAGLRSLGFDGPFSGGKHEFMVKDDLVLTIFQPPQGRHQSRTPCHRPAASWDQSQAVGACRTDVTALRPELARWRHPAPCRDPQEPQKAIHHRVQIPGDLR